MNINNLLQKNNLSQYALSKKSGVPYSTISDICSGKTDIKKCNVITVYKIASVLGCSIESLIEEVEIAEFDFDEPSYTKLDYYKSQMKNRKNVILAAESALEYMNITDNNFSKMIKVYATSYLPYPFMVKKVNNFKDIEYSSIDGVLVTSISQAIDDMLDDEDSDYQILDQALNNYYYKNNESFDGIIVSEKNLVKFNKEKEIALSYYDN